MVKREHDVKQIGERIKEAREIAGLNQKQLASLVQISNSTISRYEAGQILDIKVPIIESIARALQVDPRQLMGCAGPCECSSDSDQGQIFSAEKVDGVSSERTDAVFPDGSPDEDFPLPLQGPLQALQHTDLCFCLDGDQLHASFDELGKFAFIRQGTEILDNHIYAVQLSTTPSGRSVLKRLFHYEAAFVLMAYPSNAAPIIASPQDVTILGECIGIFDRLV